MVTFCQHVEFNVFNLLHKICYTCVFQAFPKTYKKIKMGPKYIHLSMHTNKEV